MLPDLIFRFPKILAECAIAEWLHRHPITYRDHSPLAVSSPNISVQVIHKLPIGSPFDTRPSILEKVAEEWPKIENGHEKGSLYRPPNSFTLNHS